ncbi:MAG: insulinase family protein [Holosporales bacterium]|jgi:zinc protease|nr:insulinase family protein [Holosporales bacterium]
MIKLNSTVRYLFINLALISTAFSTADKTSKAASAKVSPKEKTSNQQPQKNITPIDIQEEVLENGLRIVVINTKCKGAVVFGVLYFVGSADDPRSSIGVSHFTEHLMFGGTKNLGSMELKELLGRYNANTNAFTNNDVTCYTHYCRKEFLDINLKIEADRMQNLLLDEDYINREREVIIEERKTRLESDPRQKFMVEAAYKIMYLYSTYSYPVIGYVDQILRCDKATLLTHYNKFYKPNNAVIVLVGDIKLKEAVNLVRKYFGGIQKKDDVKRKRVIDPKQSELGLTYTIEHESEQTSMHDLDTIYNIDRNLINTIKKVIIVEIIQNILAGGEDSILSQNMVDKKELVYVIGSYVDIKAYDKGRFSISTIMREGKNVKTVDAALTELINNFPNLLTPELFERAKAKMLDCIEMMEDDPEDVMQWCVTNLGNRYRISDIRNVKKILQEITFEEVKQMARTIFTKKNRIMQIYTHPNT